MPAVAELFTPEGSVVGRMVRAPVIPPPPGKQQAKRPRSDDATGGGFVRPRLVAHASSTTTPRQDVLLLAATSAVADDEAVIDLFRTNKSTLTATTAGSAFAMLGGYTPAADAAAAAAAAEQQRSNLSFLHRTQSHPHHHGSVLADRPASSGDRAAATLFSSGCFVGTPSGGCLVAGPSSTAGATSSITNVSSSVPPLAARDQQRQRGHRTAAPVPEGHATCPPGFYLPPASAAPAAADRGPSCTFFDACAQGIHARRQAFPTTRGGAASLGPAAASTPHHTTASASKDPFFTSAARPAAALGASPAATAAQRPTASSSSGHRLLLAVSLADHLAALAQQHAQDLSLLALLPMPSPQQPQPQHQLLLHGRTSMASAAGSSPAQQLPVATPADPPQHPPTAASAFGAARNDNAMPTDGKKQRATTGDAPGCDGFTTTGTTSHSRHVSPGSITTTAATQMCGGGGSPASIGTFAPDNGLATLLAALDGPHRSLLVDLLHCMHRIDGYPHEAHFAALTLFARFLAVEPHALQCGPKGQGSLLGGMLTLAMKYATHDVSIAAVLKATGLAAEAHVRVSDVVDAELRILSHVKPGVRVPALWTLCSALLDVVALALPVGGVGPCAGLAGGDSKGRHPVHAATAWLQQQQQQRAADAIAISSSAAAAPAPMAASLLAMHEQHKRALCATLTAMVTQSLERLLLHPHARGLLGDPLLPVALPVAMGLLTLEDAAALLPPASPSPTGVPSSTKMADCVHALKAALFDAEGESQGL